jgi:hypothetical protein
VGTIFCANANACNNDAQGLDMNNSFLVQAIQTSRSLHSKYLAEHKMISTRETRDLELTLPCARYQVILEAGRERLCLLFSVQDIVAMVDCYRGYIFTVDRFSMMASDLCDNYNVDFNDYNASEHRKLIYMLDELDIFLKIALADALEQLWSHDATGEKEILECFGNLGILLRV